MTSKERLKQYIKQDMVYQSYKKDPTQKFNDFEKFCIQLCEDIKSVLDENKKLYELCDKLDQEHNTTFQIWKQGIEKGKIV